jgi:endoglycosylceramidase
MESPNIVRLRRLLRFRSWKTSGIPALLLGAALCDASATTVSHNGRWLIDAQGRVLTVHGFNMVNKLPPYTPQSVGFGDDDAAFLEANGFNAVRLGVIWSGVEPLPGIYDSAYVTQIKQTQQTLANHHIYSLLDWHQDEYNELFGGEGFPGWAVDTGGLAPASPLHPFPDEYFDDPAQKAAWDHLYQNAAAADGVGIADHLAAAEAYVASYFVGEPGVLGYDLINEPWQGTSSGSAAEETVLGALEQKLMKSIRTVDTQHLAFYEPTIFYALHGGIELPVFDDARAGLSFHDYCFEPGAMNKSLYELICGSVLDVYRKSALARSEATGDALLLTEFGSTTPYALRLVVDAAEREMIPWIDWAYCGCGDPTTSIQPPEQEGIVHDPAAALGGTNIDPAKLTIFVRPYPQAIAGTPKYWWYDTSTGVFKLSYSTTSPGDVTRSPGANTVVFVPSLEYPNGYRVTVNHGTIVSGNGTQTLEIAAKPGASTVTVTLWKR